MFSSGSEDDDKEDEDFDANFGNVIMQYKSDDLIDNLG
jgi:hypothetical protein